MLFAKFLGSVLCCSIQTIQKIRDTQFALGQYQQPDLFYANRYMKLIESEMFS